VIILDMRELKVMISELRQLQLERLQRRRQNKTNMTTFNNVRVQQGADNEIFSANVAILQGFGITIIPIDVSDRQKRDVIVKEDIENFDNEVVDAVTIFFLDRRRPDPLIMFSSPEEQQRFVVSLRHYIEYSNPEQNADGEVNQNAGQQQVDEDSGRESGNSNEIV
jgi:hypothetical protein